MQGTVHIVFSCALICMTFQPIFRLETYIPYASYVMLYVSKKPLISEGLKRISILLRYVLLEIINGPIHAIGYIWPQITNNKFSLFQMKKKSNYIFAVFFFLFSSIQVSGQSLGFGAGMNISNQKRLSSDPIIQGIFDDEGNIYKHLLGFNAGAYYDFYFTNRLALRTSLAYSTKGYAYNSEYDFYSMVGDEIVPNYMNIEERTRLDYVQLNPMFKYTFPIGEKNSIYALVGPYLSIGITGKSTTSIVASYTDPSGTTMNINESNTDMIEFGEDGDGIEFIDFGFTPAIGFQFDKVFLEVSYNLGLNNTLTDDSYDLKIYNRTFSIALGYIFEK